MKAVFCEELGPPENLVVREVESPTPGEGQVKVALKARGVSYTDYLMIQGKYQVTRELPFIPGGEAAGVVTEIGQGVTGVKVGDRVIAGGGFAEEAVMNANAVTPLPDSVTFEVAAAFRSNYTTAYYGMQRGRVKPGEVVLVHGAAGGVGLATVDMAKLMGTTVIATASTDEKLAVCKQLGADHVIDYTDGFREQVKELTGGRGADVIFDPVGGDVFDESMRCINWGGRILTIGFTSGRWPQAPVNLILIKQIAVIGVRAGEFGRRDPEKGRENREKLYAMAVAGEIDPHVCAGFPLEAAVDALRMLEKREVVGKVVVTMNDYEL